MKGEKRIPVFYSIMKGKNNRIYEAMFHVIHKVTNGGMENKKYIMGDMEILKFSFLKKYETIEKKFVIFITANVCLEEQSN